jgi:hypothetical protein
MPAPNLTPPYAIELVHYKLADDTDPEAFLALCRQVGEEFASKQPGFIHREVGTSEDGTWLIAVTWKTADDARNSIANIETIPETVKTYLGMINRDTQTRSIFEIM